MNTTTNEGAAVTSSYGERCQPFKVRMACGCIEERMMRPSTAGRPWSADAVVPGSAPCAKCWATIVVDPAALAAHQRRSLLERKAWESKHPDFRGDMDGQRYVLRNEGTRGTVPAFLSRMTEAELVEVAR